MQYRTKLMHFLLIAVGTALLTSCGGGTADVDTDADIDTGNYESPLDGSAKLVIGKWTDLTAAIVETCRAWEGGSRGEELGSFVVEVSGVNSGNLPDTLVYDVKGLAFASGVVVEYERLVKSNECDGEYFEYSEEPDDVLPGSRQTVWFQFSDSYYPNELINFASLDSAVLVIQNSPGVTLYYVKPSKNL